MKFRTLFITFLFLATVAIYAARGGNSMAATGASIEKYSYRTWVGKNSTINTWTREIKSGNIVLTSANIMTGEFNTMICNSDYETISWFYTNKKKDVILHGTRKNNLVEISGTAKGKPVHSSIMLDDGIWYQFSEFAFSHMLASNRDSAVYYIFWPEKLIFYTMKAKRVGDASISLGGNKIDAIKVKMTLTGLKSIFWSAYYWFRKQDYLFVRYEGVNGAPGTSATVIEFAGR
jgi:hypothetical protein